MIGEKIYKHLQKKGKTQIKRTYKCRGTLVKVGILGFIFRISQHLGRLSRYLSEEDLVHLQVDQGFHITKEWKTTCITINHSARIIRY